MTTVHDLPPVPLGLRERFVELALLKVDSVVLWNRDGPDVFDCSGLVAWCILKAGGPDLRATHNAQKLFDETAGPWSIEPRPGDLAFYGADIKRITHVAIWLGPERVLSADGATSRVTDLAKAQANPAARVHLHTRPYRRDFFALHQNKWLDVEPVCR